MTGQERKPVKLLLIGETGNGKSSLGNFILKKNVFTVSDSPNPETTEINGDYGEYDRNNVFVIDTPSLQESREFNERFLNDMVNSVKEQGGIQGIVIVLNYSINTISNNLKIMIQILSNVFPVSEFWGHVCIVWNKCYYFFSQNQLKMQKENKRNEFLPELLKRTKETTGTEESVVIPMCYVDSQPDEEDDNIRSENEIESLIKWGSELTPINIDIIENRYGEYKKIITEEKEQTESMGNNGKYIITQVKHMKREIRIYYNGEIRYGNWKIIKVESNEITTTSNIVLKVTTGIVVAATAVIATGTIIYFVGKAISLW
ncbi:hypothetical protein, conserved [Entamoeba dispar SAW760]|uniref:AIG1-type G domain-containing protein n=1 Tax=Entamoeba dispar (strain ATCC PRA-260 / SAW760) TaxID=370354 RepID=B0E952_ENTDS|nr:uncharacterized protein EDI_036000 [Entamoeba dispar SAW760]EDR28943.1 hypothetical protein, conserved [Entamoeba dispar SAW760]|eukprot:EDR28943.1 hypothetical protein, conserved [Entamoeba dispar SAW760]